MRQSNFPIKEEAAIFLVHELATLLSDRISNLGYGTPFMHPNSSFASKSVLQDIIMMTNSRQFIDIKLFFVLLYFIVSFFYLVRPRNKAPKP